MPIPDGRREGGSVVEVVPIDGGNQGWDEDLAPHAGASPDVIEDAGFPLVLVTWRDAWFDFDAADPEDTRPDYLVHTVGFLVREGPRFVSIAQEILPDGDGFRAVTHIPVAVVEAMSPLHPGDRGAELAAT
jgi:hypothetical protein